jgi:hypothetical protein
MNTNMNLHTEKELRELNAWIHAALFDGGKYVGLVKRGMWYRANAAGYTNHEWEAGRYLIGDAILHTTSPDCEDPVKVQSFSIPQYTTDPGAAMQVLEKCTETLPRSLEICKDGGQFWISRTDDDDTNGVMAETLPLAICLFAKKLFTTKS